MSVGEDNTLDSFAFLAQSCENLLHGTIDKANHRSSGSVSEYQYESQERGEQALTWTLVSFAFSGNLGHEPVGVSR